MDTVLRVVVTYAAIIVGLRIMGKREFSQLSPLELVTLLLIPEIFSQAIVLEDFSMTNAIMAIGTLFTVVYLSSFVRYLSPKAEVLIEGQPAVLVSHGKLVVPNLNLERVTPGEVFAEMHKAGLSRLDQVEWVMLEPDGRLAIVPKEEMRSGVTPKQATEETVAG